MKIIVFGASGGTGQEIVKQALEAGHEVTAFVRNPAKLAIQHPKLKMVTGDVKDTAAVENAVAGQEAVISALGPTRPPVPGMMEKAAQNIVAAMKNAGIRRLISTTGAGVRDPQDQPKLIDHLMKGLLTLMAGEVLKDSAANVVVIRASDLDWTIVRYPRLTDGLFSGKYRVGYVGQNSGTQLSRADGAHFVLKELVEGKFVRQMPIVSY
ncbi:MAG: NmrA family transcriptional regulator [Chloroflexi bacterium HGW-Chloroflexi-6]|nr:MAG: NmrA family transcriptional regulator [Chloroflexi bacterium HGW-Chloroflexi-6]